MVVLLSCLGLPKSDRAQHCSRALALGGLLVGNAAFGRIALTLIIVFPVVVASLSRSAASM